MANEISLSAALNFYKPAIMGSAVGRSMATLLANVAGSFFSEGTMSVATSATAIPLGQVTAPGWCWFLNLDATNFVRLHNGSGGAKCPKLKPGEFTLFPWDDTAVPYATADTAACLLEYLIISR